VQRAVRVADKAVDPSYCSVEGKLIQISARVRPDFYESVAFVGRCKTALYVSLLVCLGNSIF